MNAKVKKGIGLGINIVIWIFLVFAIVMTVLVLVANATRGDGLPSIGGRAQVNVLSGSMEPTFYEGDMLVIHTDFSDEQLAALQVGDVISFYFDRDGDGFASDVNTHRIVEVVGEGAVYYRTQGDNIATNPDPDANLVSYSAVLGIYESEHLGITGTKVSGCGSVLSFFQTSTGFLVFVVVPMAAFFVYELINFILIIVRMRREKAGAERALSEEEIKKRAIEEFLREQEAKKAAEATQSEQGTATEHLTVVAPTETVFDLTDGTSEPSEPTAVEAETSETAPTVVASEPEATSDAEPKAEPEVKLAETSDAEPITAAPEEKPVTKPTRAKTGTSARGSSPKASSTRASSSKTTKSAGATVRSSGKKSTTKTTLPGMSKTTKKSAPKKTDKKDD